MSKDRYSNDHTVEIVGDTNTLTVSDNISAAGNITATNDLIAGNAVLTDTISAESLTTITVSDDVSMSGDLAVTGSTTVSTDLTVSGTTTITDLVGSAGDYSVKLLTKAINFSYSSWASDKLIIDLTADGLTSSTNIYSMVGEAYIPALGYVFGPSYNGDQGDYRFGLTFDSSTQALYGHFYGTSWSGLISVQFKLMIWYA